MCRIAACEIVFSRQIVIMDIRSRFDILDALLQVSLNGPKFLICNGIVCLKIGKMDFGTIDKCHGKICRYIVRDLINIIFEKTITCLEKYQMRSNDE